MIKIIGRGNLYLKVLKMNSCFSNIRIPNKNKNVKLCAICKKEDAMSFTDICFNCYIGIVNDKIA